MIDDNSMLGELLEKGQAVTDPAKKSVTDFANSVKTQVIGDKNIQSGQSVNPNSQVPQSDQVSSEAAAINNDNREFVREFYSPSDQQASNNPSLAAEDSKRKLDRLRKELHDEIYFKRLNNPPSQEKPSKAEELEMEKQKEMQELNEKEAQKPPPLNALQRTQRNTEIKGGIGG